MAPEWQIRRELADFARTLYTRGFVSATDGNISTRVMGDRMFITPSGSCLGDLRPADFLYVDFFGRVLAGAGAASSEFAMHRTIYERRPDVHAVIHAHPPMAVACSVAGVPLDAPVIPEVIVTLGGIPTTGYATPSSDESARVVGEWIDRHDALLLDRHGSVTVGRSLAEAFRKLEKVEYCAQVVLAARQAGQVQTLTPDQLARLDEVARRLGMYQPRRSLSPNELRRPAS